MSSVTEFIRFKIRAGLAAALAALNEVPLSREMVAATDARNFKLGDGLTHFNDLPWWLIPWAAASGTNTITATFADKPVLFDGMLVRIRAGGANTGAATFNPNGLGALDLKKQGGTALAASDIASAGHELLLVYRASVPRWELLNPAQGTGGGGSSTENYVFATSTATASTSSTIPLDGTIPQNTEGAALSALDVTITPTDAANDIEVIFTLPVISANGAATFIWGMFQDSGADAINAGSFELSGGDWSGPIVARYVVVAGSTAARTYKLRYGNPSGARTVFVNRLSSVSGLFGGSSMAVATAREIFL